MRDVLNSVIVSHSELWISEQDLKLGKVVNSGLRFIDITKERARNKMTDCGGKTFLPLPLVQVYIGESNGMIMIRYTVISFNKPT